MKAVEAEEREGRGRVEDDVLRESEWGVMEADIRSRWTEGTRLWTSTDNGSLSGTGP